MIYSLISLLVALWFISLLAHFGGSFIHGLLVLAAAIWLIDFITGRRASV